MTLKKLTTLSARVSCVGLPGCRNNGAMVATAAWFDKALPGRGGTLSCSHSYSFFNLTRPASRSLLVSASLSPVPATRKRLVLFMYSAVCFAYLSTRRVLVSLPSASSTPTILAVSDMCPLPKHAS